MNSLHSDPIPRVNGLIFKFVLKNGEEFPLSIRKLSGNGWALLGASNSVFEKTLEFFKRNNIAVEVTDPQKDNKRQ